MVAAAFLAVLTHSAGWAADRLISTVGFKRSSALGGSNRSVAYRRVLQTTHLVSEPGRSDIISFK